MAIFKEYLTLSDFELAKKPFDETNRTYYINEDDEAIEGDPDFKWNQVVFCKEGKFIMTRRSRYGIDYDNIYTKSEIEDIVSSYLPLTGGTMSGKVEWKEDGKISYTWVERSRFGIIGASKNSKGQISYGEISIEPKQLLFNRYNDLSENHTITSQMAINSIVDQNTANIKCISSYNKNITYSFGSIIASKDQSIVELCSKLPDRTNFNGCKLYSNNDSSDLFLYKYNSYDIPNAVYCGVYGDNFLIGFYREGVKTKDIVLSIESKPNENIFYVKPINDDFNTCGLKIEGATQNDLVTANKGVKTIGIDIASQSDLDSLKNTISESGLYDISDTLFSKVDTDTLDDLYIQLYGTDNNITDPEQIYNILNNPKNHFQISEGVDTCEVHINRSKGTNGIRFDLTYEDTLEYTDGKTIVYRIGINYNNTTKKFTLVSSVARQTITWEILGWYYELNCYDLPNTIVYHNGDIVCLCSGYKLNQATGEYFKLEKNEIISKWMDNNTNPYMESEEFYYNSSLDGSWFDIVSTNYSDYTEHKSNATMWYYWVVNPTISTGSSSHISISGINSQNSSNGIDHPYLTCKSQNFTYLNVNYNPYSHYTYLLNWGNYKLTINFAYIGNSYNEWGATVISTTKDPFPTEFRSNDIQLYLTEEGRFKLINQTGEYIVSDILLPNRTIENDYSDVKIELYMWNNVSGQIPTMRIYLENTVYDYTPAEGATNPMEQTPESKDICYLSWAWGDTGLNGGWFLNNKNNNMLHFDVKDLFKIGMPEQIKPVGD